MGILHNAIGEDFPLVAILDKGDFEAIRGEAWNISARHFYTLTWHETKTISISGLSICIRRSVTTRQSNLESMTLKWMLG